MLTSLPVAKKNATAARTAEGNTCCWILLLKENIIVKIVVRLMDHIPTQCRFFLRDIVINIEMGRL
jgi:hypothetical protein